MATTFTSTGPRNKILHRFYEPLMVLHALSRNQGDHISRPNFERKPLKDVSKDELRRLYFEAISYSCDYEKGGAATTAIYATSNPLTYHIACNKAPKEDVVIFVQVTLTRLATLYDADTTERVNLEAEILNTCINFSRPRLLEYRKALRITLERCMEESMPKALSEKISQIQTAFLRLEPDVEGLRTLCKLCRTLMKPSGLDLIKERIRTTEIRGNLRCNFSDLRHYIGRLAYHVRMVRIMVLASLRLPHLFEQPEINRVPVEPYVSLIGRRERAGLSEIAGRMITAGDDTDLSDIKQRLEDLDRKFKIGRIIDEEYGKKSFKPRIHAELRLLEYLHAHRDELEPVDGEWYIGCSKPACYCCWLYIRNHPGKFVQPATHQNLYPNWAPPTNVPDVLKAGSAVALHERVMLNRMNVDLRKRTIDRIKSCTGRRRKQFDSVTGDTYTDNATLQQDQAELVEDENSGLERINSGSDESLATQVVDDVAHDLDKRLNISITGDGEEDDSLYDSDAEGGVPLM